MANTRNDVTIPAKTWTNLYLASGITVGTAVSVINKGINAAYISVEATTPAAPTGMPKGVPSINGGVTQTAHLPTYSAKTEFVYLGL